MQMPGIGWSAADVPIRNFACTLTDVHAQPRAAGAHPAVGSSSVGESPASTRTSSNTRSGSVRTTTR